MCVSQKLSGLNNFESVKNQHFRSTGVILFIFFKNCVENKKNLEIFFTASKICVSFHTNRMNVAELFCRR